jgi:2,3-bisphosphoglycerate-dependent phosphoglycerate mutase
MQFYFLRHAQSINNALWTSTGSSQGRDPDPELTKIGLKQAQYLGEFLRKPPSPVFVNEDGRDPQNLAGFGITHLYCSLMLRAIQTGTIVANIINLPLRAWIDIHEEGGIYLDDEVTGEFKPLPGFTRTYLQQHYPNLILPENLTDEGWWNRPFETEADRLERAERVYKELLDVHGGTDDHVAIVSHGGFYNLLMHVILNRTLDRNSWFVMNNAAISRVDFERGNAYVYSNRADFLPAELIT